MLDTGLGIEAGYSSDAEMTAADNAKRAAMPPETRELIESAERRLDAAIFGPR